MKIVRNDGEAIELTNGDREVIWNGLWAAYGETDKCAVAANKSGYNDAERELNVKLERLEKLADFMGRRSRGQHD